MMETESVLKEIRRNGFIVMRDFFAGDVLDRLEAEASWFLSNSRNWFETKCEQFSSYAIISPQRIPPEERAKVKTIEEVFSRPIFLQTCREYLSKKSLVDRIIVHTEVAHPQPVTEWHADQQSDGLLSFKFMLYLSDVSEDTGAFSYVPGSHSIVKKIMQQAKLRGVSNTQVHNFEQIRQLAYDLRLPDCIRTVEEMCHHIKGDYESDNFYSISAPKGSVIMFDTKGIHRGGAVIKGSRKLMRVHCFEAPPLTWKGRVRQVLGKLRRQDKPLFDWN